MADLLVAVGERWGSCDGWAAAHRVPDDVLLRLRDRVLDVPAA
jgi:hypothetical protein